MKKLFYTITTLEPLIISRHAGDPNMTETMEYLRGTMIQGLFAQQYLKKKKLDKADKDFFPLIMRGDCIFSNAYPFVDNLVYYPAPFSIVKEKYNEKAAHDLLSEVFDEQTKGISDLLAIQEGRIITLVQCKEIRLHIQIENKSRTTEKGILFNYQSLSAGITLKGGITVNNETTAGIIHDLVPSGSEMRIGKSAKSEYGKILFEWVPGGEEGVLASNGRVILTMLSDTIVYNHNGFSTTDLTSLSGYIKGANIQNAISKKVQIDGFVNAWKLKKPSENAFAAGSAFLLDKVPENADYLLAKGLGERTNEGYGQVTFAIQSVEPLNYLFEQPLISAPEKPSTTPVIAGKVLAGIILERTKAKISLKALKDADGTDGIMTNHLISKLRGMAQVPDSFLHQLKDLPKPSTDKLKKVYIGDHNLLEHLKNIDKDFLKQYSEPRSIEGTIINLSGSVQELKRIYFEQYFIQLRRKNIDHE